MKAVPDDLAERLHANADTFLELGDDARLDDLAERIGVARATLYYYFSGKDDLTSFSMKEKLGRIGRAIAEQRNAAHAPLEAFQAALHAIIDDLCAEPGMCVHLTATQSRPKALSEITHAMRIEILAPLRENLIEARASGTANVTDIDTTISAILGAINRTVLHHWTTNGTVSPEAIREAVHGLFFEGLNPRAAAV